MPENNNQVSNGGEGFAALLERERRRVLEHERERRMENDLRYNIPPVPVPFPQTTQYQQFALDEFDVVVDDSPLPPIVDAVDYLSPPTPVRDRSPKPPAEPINPGFFEHYL